MEIKGIGINTNEIDRRYNMIQFNNRDYWYLDDKEYFRDMIYYKR